MSIAGLYCSYGQNSMQDSVYILHEISVSSPKFSHTEIFSHTTKADSLIKADFANTTVGDLLGFFGTMSIKSYGPGTLASVTSRGTSAVNTAVNWNGFNINSPMNGQSDFSQIPVFIADEISIQYGGSSAAWGSGSAGGTINFFNSIPSDTGINLTIAKETGSFGLNRTNLKAKARWNKGAIVLRAYTQKSNNNYEYKNIAKKDSPSEILQNANGELSGLMPELYFLINKHQSLIIKTWMQQTIQCIPPTMLTNNNNEKQSDMFSRTMAEWKYEKNSNYISIKAARFRNTSWYFSNLQIDTSIHKSYNNNIEAEGNFNIYKNLHALLSLIYSSENVTSTDYSEEATKNILSPSTLINWSIPAYNLYASFCIRKEFSNFPESPLVYSIGIKKRIHKYIYMNLSASRNYRNPSLNDLYWTPGGNPDLKPENGYSQEAGLKWQKPTSSFKSEAELYIYNNNIHKRIMWLPKDNIWTAQNYDEVWCRGIEINASVVKTFNKIYQINVRTAGSYNKATSQGEINENNGTKGKQLIYVPVIVSNSSVSFSRKQTKLSFYWHYTGKRYTSSDNSSFIKPYNLANISISQTFKLKYVNINIYIKINNLFNSDYQVMEWRPMPPANYSTGISLSFRN